MLLILFVGSVAVAWAAHWWLYSGEDARLFSKIPGPPGLPLIGNGLNFLVNNVSVFYKSRTFANLYPDLFKLQVLDKRVVIVYNPTDIETVLSSSKHNEKGYLYTFLRPWLQEGLLLSNGAKWHSRRKILTPAFHFNILRDFSHILEENSCRLVRDLQLELNQEKTDLIPLMSSYTLQSICETAMGCKIEDKTRNYEKAIYELGESFITRMTSFWLHPNWAFKLSSLGRRQKQTIREVQSFPRRVIEERRQYRQLHGYTDADDDSTVADAEPTPGAKKRMAMLDLLLAAELDGLIDNAGIQEEVDTFMFEGHDTTAAALSFTLLCLANCQDEQEKVRSEIDRIFGESDRAATMADLNEMKYLECCVKEALRLYPSVPFIARYLGETVQLSNYVVPAGVQCHINIFDLHRRADLFSEPLKYLPERFQTKRGDSKHPYAYIPFSAGARNCIGQRFALMELKSAVSAILRQYRLLPVTTHEDIVFTSDLVLRVAHPVFIKFTSR